MEQFRYTNNTLNAEHRVYFEGEHEGQSRNFRTSRRYSASLITLGRNILKKNKMRPNAVLEIDGVIELILRYDRTRLRLISLDFSQQTNKLTIASDPSLCKDVGNRISVALRLTILQDFHFVII